MERHPIIPSDNVDELPKEYRELLSDFLNYKDGDGDTDRDIRARTTILLLDFFRDRDGHEHHPSPKREKEQTKALLEAIRGLKKLLEPGAIPPAARYNALRSMHNSGELHLHETLARDLQKLEHAYMDSLATLDNRNKRTNAAKEYRNQFVQEIVSLYEDHHDLPHDEYDSGRRAFVDEFFRLAGEPKPQDLARVVSKALCDNLRAS